MKYLSLDLETTCLTPSPKNILMISAIVEDTEKDIDLYNLPHFTCYVNQDKIEGSAYALSMNSWILDIISKRKKNITGYPIYRKEEMFDKFIKFLDKYFGDDKINLAGKNIASFDFQFLPFHIQRRFRSRMIDPGSVFVDWTKDRLMGLQEIKESKNIKEKVSHDAREDALDVIRILRTSYLR